MAMSSPSPSPSPLEDVSVGMEEAEEEQQRPLNRALLHRSATNNTSQVAMVGSNPCPIESLDYEMIENELFDQNWRTRSKGDQVRYVVLKWTFCFAIGILTGTVGFFNNLAVENVAGFKLQAVSALMDSTSYWTAFWVFAGSNLALLLLASSITAFVSPAAGGSGIPEVKAYLNGVDAPNIFSLRTLAVKVVGNIAAVSSSLHVGKAGPMVHTGACVAAIFGQGGSRRYGLTCRWLRYFKNDRDRRDLVTIGAGAGVAAAFRAPVGGVLFALESLSSWWRSALIWRSFFTTAVVAVVLRLFIDLCGSGRCGMFGRGGLIMYDVGGAGAGFDDLMTYHLKDIPTVILIGVTGALLGALYNFLMIKVLRLYNAINERGGAHKLLLAATVSIVTSCCVFGLPWLAPCRPCPTPPPPTGTLSSSSPADETTTCHALYRFRRFQCPAGHYNDLASLFLNINDDAIRNLYSTGTNDVYHPASMAIFFLASYALGVLSYGVVAPSGLFVPIILTGATYGRLAAMLLAGSGSSSGGLDHGLVAILGSASFLGGTLRMTVSVCVVILELTNNLLLLPLVMLVLLVSKTVADSFNSSVYDLILRLKGLPHLDGHAEPYMRQLAVGDVVAGPLRSFAGVEKVGNVVHTLRTTGHHAFPVVDEAAAAPPVLYGLVLRAHLLVLLKKKEYFMAAAPAPGGGERRRRHSKEYVAGRFQAEDFDKRGSGKQDTIADVELSPEEMEMYVDLHPFTNTSPYTVVETMSLAKALVLFREVGLRHLLVVPKSCDRSPVVGILTRHDFMPEHILGLHPALLKSRWKRLRWQRGAVAKYFRSLIVWVANTG